MNRQARTEPLAIVQFTKTIEFVNSPLTSKTLDRWRRTARQYLVGPGFPYAGAWTDPTTDPLTLSLRQLRTLQADAGLLLRQLADSRDRKGTPFIWLNVGAVKIATRTVGGQTHILVAGSADQVFRHILIRLLEQVGIDRLYTCPYDRCNKLFLKNGRRKYCSTRCQRNDYMREYRA